MLQRHGWGVHMAKGYTNGKGLHMEQRGAHTIPGYALRTNPNYTDKVEIYTEVGKQRWIWRGVTYVRKRFRLEETHREGLHTEGEHGKRRDGLHTEGEHEKRKTHGGRLIYKGLSCKHRCPTAVYTLNCPLLQPLQCTTICV